MIRSPGAGNGGALRLSVDTACADPGIGALAADQPLRMVRGQTGPRPTFVTVGRRSRRRLSVTAHSLERAFLTCSLDPVVAAEVVLAQHAPSAVRKAAFHTVIYRWNKGGFVDQGEQGKRRA
jgi:hypothetical protein